MFKTTLIAVLLTALVGAFAVVKFGFPIAAIAPAPKNGWERKAALETPAKISQLASQPNSIANWPPATGKPFPQFDLFDHNGRSFRFESLRGKPTVIEFISMSCAGCQAFAGGNEHGPYGELASQADLESFETYFRQYAGFDLDSGKVNFVVVVVYNDKLQSPTAQDLNDWRNHFKMYEHKNVRIVSSTELASGETFRMIPGFMLLDQKQRVVFDATGHQPKHNLFTELLPGVKSLLRK